MRARRLSRARRQEIARLGALAKHEARRKRRDEQTATLRAKLAETKRRDAEHEAAHEAAQARLVEKLARLMAAQRALDELLGPESSQADAW